MVKRNTEMISDEKVQAATGHGRDHWFALLDEAGAVKDGWSHKEMAVFLTENGVDDWWAQGVTVSYEQARGLRKPGERADGTFDASASKTLNVSLEELWPWLVEAERRSQWLGAGYELTGETAGKSVRLAGPEGAKVTINFYGPSGASGGEGAPKQRLQAQVANLADADAVAAMKAHWKGALAALAELVA